MQNELLIGIPTILIAAWVIYITLRHPRRWSYEINSQMKSMKSVDAKVCVALFVMAAVAYWIIA